MGEIAWLVLFKHHLKLLLLLPRILARYIVLIQVNLCQKLFNEELAVILWVSDAKIRAPDRDLPVTFLTFLDQRVLKDGGNSQSKSEDFFLVKILKNAFNKK